MVLKGLYYLTRHCEERDSSPVIARDRVPKQSLAGSAVSKKGLLRFPFTTLRASAHRNDKETLFSLHPVGSLLRGSPKISTPKWLVSGSTFEVNR